MNRVAPQRNRERSSGLQNLARLRVNLLVFELPRIPTTAESLYQIDRVDHLLAEQLRLQPFAGEEGGLRSNNVEISGDSADVTIIGDRQGAAGIFNGRSLSGKRLRNRAQISDAVPDPLGRRKYILAVIGGR